MTGDLCWVMQPDPTQQVCPSVLTYLVSDQAAAFSACFLPCVRNTGCYTALLIFSDGDRSTALPMLQRHVSRCRSCIVDCCKSINVQAEKGAKE